MTIRIQARWWSLLIPAIVIAGAAAPASTVSELDEARSRVIVEVGKAGAFSFVAGHSHKVEAPIQGTLSVDSNHPENTSAAFEIRARDLTVMEDGEPPGDVPRVQQTMLSERVLDVGRYPTVTFQSRGIQVRQRSGNTLELEVNGDLTLHGTTRPITVPVHAELGPELITAEGTFAVKQSDYGIEPVSVAGGTVRVKDELKIRFALLASVRSQDSGVRR